MADTRNPNPYQLYANPLPIPPSRGGVGDFLREITTFRGVHPQQATVPTAATDNPYGVLQGPEAYQNLPVAPAVTPTAARQVGGQTIIPQVAAPVVKQPALNNFLPAATRQQINKQNLDFTNPEARVVAPKGYVPPTAEDRATAQAVSNAYWAPYHRQAALQERGLQIKELEARGKVAPKVPTLRDQLYGQAVDAANELYKIDVEAANALKTPDEQAKARVAARRELFNTMKNLAQPTAAQASLID